MSHSVPMPIAMVSTVLRLHHATAAATSAAISRGLRQLSSSVPGATNTTAGTAIAVSIATGT